MKALRREISKCTEGDIFDTACLNWTTNTVSHTMTEERDMKVNIGDYDLVTMIGTGCFQAATVHLARHKASGELRAIKKIELDECRLDLEAIQQELAMHRILRHPHLLSSQGATLHGSEIWAAFPLMAYGSCRDLLAAHFRDGMPELATLYITRDIARGLEYMHHRGLVHRALTSSHVLVSGEGRAVIAGFHHVIAIQGPGGRRKHALHHFPPGSHFTTCMYVTAPEVLQQNRAGYNSRADIYSLGVLVCELATGTAPYSNLVPTQLLLCKLLGPGVLSELDDGAFSPQLQSLVEACVQQDPSHRPSAATLLQHAVFRLLTSSTPPLPELLQPVSPLTSLDLNALSKQQNTDDVETVTKAVQEADLDSEEEDDEWTF